MVAKGRRPRIGVDAHVLDGKEQGSRTVVRRLLHALSSLAERYDILVYCFEPDRWAAEYAGSGLQFRRLRHHAPLVRLMLEFPRAFARDGIDLGLFQYVAPPLVAGRSIVVIHDLLPFTHPEFFPSRFRWRTTATYAASIRRAAGVLVVSDYTRGEVAKAFPAQAGGVRAMLNGPSFEPERMLQDAAGAAPEGLRSGRYVLAVGRIERRKNIDLAVRAFLAADLEDVDMVVVGRPDLRFRWSPPADPRIRMLEHIDDERLMALYRHAGLFVYPSSAEGFGLPLLDATLFGLPVIASDQTSLPEVGGDLAEYFDPTAADAEAWLAGRIREHFTVRPVARPTPAQRAAQAERFSWRAAARVLDEALDAALVRLGRSPGEQGRGPQ